MWSILKNYDPSWINNSREIIREKLQYMTDYPSERQARRLESFIEGISVDFSDKDWGNEPEVVEN